MKKQMFYVNPHTDTAERMMVEDDLSTFYKMLNCDCFDIVQRRIGGKRYEFICDDEGTFVDDPRISAINDMGEPMFVGSLLVCGIADDEGELTGLTDEDCNHIAKHIMHMGTRKHPEGWKMLVQVEY